MSVASVGMGALRTAFQMLFDAVKSVQEETTMFKHLLGDIKSTLNSLQPLIQEIEKYNSKEGLEYFTVQMEKGADLVQKCSKVGVWKKSKYTKKLHQLEKSLRRVFDELKLQGVRDARETLVSLRNIEMAFSRIEKNLVMTSNQPETVKCSYAVPEPPSVTVGLDLPLKELKMKLLKDEKVSMLVLTAAGGCGKTTLAKKFCQDQEVKDLGYNRQKGWRKEPVCARWSQETSMESLQCGDRCEYWGLPRGVQNIGENRGWGSGKRSKWQI